MNTHDCYRILAAEPGCSWDELRTAYRRQVHQWHPDRYQQQPDLAAEAEQRMLKINAAFEQLAAYFERHGELPLKRPRADAARSRATRHTGAHDDHHVARRPRRRDRGRSAGFWLVLLIFGAVAYYASQPAEEPPGDMGPPAVAPAADNGTAAPPPTARNAPAFGYGDKPGDVFAAQGVPSRTAGDIWYYGESEVHFERGTVAKWFSSPENPLNTRATSSSILGDTKAAKPKKDPARIK